MKILIHYTVQEFIYNQFKNTCEITNAVRIEEVKNFYDTNYRNQDTLFLIISYFESRESKYRVGKIIKKDGNFFFNKVSSELSAYIIDELAIEERNTYDSSVFYKILYIEERLEFRDKRIDEYLSKIKLKYFDWEDLLGEKILYKKVSDIIFNRDNVMELATTYNPDLQYTDSILEKKYFSALQNLGFIIEEGIDITKTILHGDIGEFLMHHLVSHFMESDNEKYIYPKLAFKTSPKMAVYGNDGTIYIPKKKEIYYMEAKFYPSLSRGIKKATASLQKHNNESEVDMNYNAELFRNIETHRLNEVIEVTDEVVEKLIIFVICDDVYSEQEIKKIIQKNVALPEIRASFEVLIFVLPILSKEEFLEFFAEKSMEEGNVYYGR